MTRFKAQGRRYHHHLGSSYMGAGRTEDSFTYKPRPSFSKIKQIYGEHLENIHPDYPGVKARTPLDQATKQAIIAKINAQHRKVLIRQIAVGLITTILVIALAIYLSYISNFEHFLS